jgi:hypothetical protein
MHTLLCGDHRLRKNAGAIATRSTTAGRFRARPVRGRARHEMLPRKIGAQPLAGLQLLRLDQGAAITTTPACQPRKWGFPIRQR